jgi:hypothetical protein
MKLLTIPEIDTRAADPVASILGYGYRSCLLPYHFHWPSIQMSASIVVDLLSMVPVIAVPVNAQMWSQRK